MRAAIGAAVFLLCLACSDEGETGGKGSGGTGGAGDAAAGSGGFAAGGGLGGTAGGGAGGTAGGSGAAGASGGGGASGSGGSGGQYLVMARSELEALPTSGAAWDYLLARADEARAVTLDAASEGSPWLPNYNDSGPGQRLPARFLGAALVVASSWSGDKAPYRTAVEQALRHVMGSEEEPSTDGTADGDRLLATARQLPAWILSADLVGFDRALTGTRTRPGADSGTDWTQTSFETWASTIVTKTIGTHGRWKTIRGTQENSASNWGAHCNASRVAVALYRGDQSELSRAVQVLRGFLGDSSSYPAYPQGQTPPLGDGFQTTASFDPSWACNYAEAVGGWLPINADACGAEKNGIVVEDIGRSAGAFPTFDDTGIGYTKETMAGLHLAALLLERQGQPAFSWSSNALLRSMEWLDAQGQLPGSSGSVQHHVPWITNHFYGTSLPTEPAVMGRGFGFTDWLYP